MNDVIVDAARNWIGTPYIHQASAKGAGSDCLGLVRGVWRDLLGDEPELPPNYTKDWGEQGQASLLHEAALRHLIPKDKRDAAAGDVILFRMRATAVAKHVGIQAQVGNAPTFVHAYSGHCVQESPLSAAWARKIVARFAYPLER